VHIHDWPTDEILGAFCGAGAPALVIHHHAYGFICPGYDLFWRKQRKICVPGFGARCIPNAMLKQCQMSRKPGAILKAFLRVRKNLRYMHRADLFLANSTYTRSRLLGQGVPDDKIRVLGYFTDLQHHASHAQRVPGRILFLGRLVESKGLERLLSITSRLRQGVDWSLLIVGDGYHRSEVIQLVRQSRDRERIQIIPWADKETKTRLLCQASVVAVPSVWAEAMGIVGIEAMACAKPVVAFDVGGIRDWLSDGRTGFLIEPYDEAEFARKLEILLTNPGLALQMGEAARDDADRQYRHQSHVESLLRLYAFVAKQRPWEKLA